MNGKSTRLQLLKPLKRPNISKVFYLRAVSPCINDAK